MRVAMATAQAPSAVWRAPYRRTLHEYFHIQQQDRFADLRARGNALHLASLVGLAVNEPKKLNDEHQRLLMEAGFFPSVETSKNEAIEFAKELLVIDKNNEWHEAEDA